MAQIPAVKAALAKGALAGAYADGDPPAPPAPVVTPGEAAAQPPASAGGEQCQPRPVSTMGRAAIPTDMPWPCQTQLGPTQAVSELAGEDWVPPTYVYEQAPMHAVHVSEVNQGGLVRMVGSVRDGLFTGPDGKGERTCKPGTGEAVQRLSASLNMHVDMVQEAYYNGYHKFHGLRVQHIIDASSMITCFATALRDGDSKVFVESGMKLQIASLFVNGDAN